MGHLLAACLAAIRFGWQIATLTGGAPRKFLSAGCSIKDARLGESETSGIGLKGSSVFASDGTIE